MRHGRLLRRIALATVTAIVLYGFAPAVIAVLGSWPRVTSLQPWWLAAMAGAQIGSTWSLWRLQAIAIGTEDRFAIATSQLAGGALGRIIPGGAATASAAQYGMIAAATDDDVRRSSVATGLAMATALQVAALCALPLLALPAVVFGLIVPSTFAHAMLLGLAIFAAMAVIALIANYSEPFLHFVGGAIYRVGHRIPRWDPPADLGDRLVAHRDEARARLGDRLIEAILGALGRWIFDLLVLVAAVMAVGATPSLWLILLAFFTVQLLAQVSITPGGIGVVEAGLTAALVVAGMSGGAAAVVTLAYRLFTYWLMLPAGLIAWVAHRRRIRRAGREEFDPDELLHA